MTVTAFRKKPKLPQIPSTAGTFDGPRKKNKKLTNPIVNPTNCTTQNETPTSQVSPTMMPYQPPVRPEQPQGGQLIAFSSPPPPYSDLPPVYNPIQMAQSMSSLNISYPPMAAPQNLHTQNPRSQALNPSPHRQNRTADRLNQGAALLDVISSKMNSVITAIDGEIFGGEEEELIITLYPSALPPPQQMPVSPADRQRQVINLPQAVPPPSNYFAKVWYYSNSRLPPSLPPLKLYMPTYPLLCLAAQYSLRAYDRPTQSSAASINSTNTQATQYISANWRQGTKAMLLKVQPLDERSCICIAIRGSQTFMDWAVNFRQAPAPPTNFLDDAGNLVHSGFLQVARAMTGPIAAHLRTLLQENPARAHASLLLTGHSAGGAVASLLYSHMLAQSSSVHSELHSLTSFFKRVHCITFGAPPVSLLPLQRSASPALRKSLFLAFLNEGDPVVRADSAAVRSLLALYAAPLPSPAQRPPPAWPVPENQLSNAGRLIVMRPVARRRHGPRRSGAASEETIEACVTSDEQLRGVVFGDPLMHMMRVYARRIETLATSAVTAGVFGDR